MRKIYFGIIIYNILLITFVFYTIFFANNDIKMNYLKDVSGKGEEEGIEVLSDYQIAIEYVESQVEKDVILYSKPAAGELVYENQMVTLYVSKGYFSEKYRKLENMMYDDCKEYLESLTKNYKIEVVITYEKNNKHLDGLIYKQNTLDEYIDMFDTIELIVISNPKSIYDTNFTGWYYKDVIKYAEENSINVEFEYISILFPKDYVVGQSVLEGTEVLKNSNPIIIYLAKEN